MLPCANPSRKPKRHLDQFSHFGIYDCRVSLYFTMGAPSPSKLPLPMGGSGPPSNTWFPGHTRVLNPNGISIRSVIFSGLINATDKPTDRPTDHATRSVTIDHIYVRAMQSKNTLKAFVVNCVSNFTVCIKICMICIAQHSRTICYF